MQTQANRFALTVHAILVATFANVLATVPHLFHAGLHIALPLVHLSAEAFGLVGHFETHSRVAAVIELVALVVGLAARRSAHGVA